MPGAICPVTAEVDKGRDEQIRRQQGVEQQICVLIAAHNLAGKLEVIREKHLLHICPVS